MKTKYTLQELKDKKIAIKCETEEHFKLIKLWVLEQDDVDSGMQYWGRWKFYWFFTNDNSWRLTESITTWSNHIDSTIKSSEFILDEEIAKKIQLKK